MKTLHFILFMVLSVGVGGLPSQILQRHKRNWIIDSFSINEGYDGQYPYILDKVQIQKNLSYFEIHGQGVDQEPRGVFSINRMTGEIMVHKPVDFEQFKELKLVFMARDDHSHDMHTRLGIEIKVIDANDNVPTFEHEIYEISIKESTKQGRVIITIKATDADSGDNQKFDLRIVSITPKPEGLEFLLTEIADTGAGTISFKGCLDYEKAEKYTIIVEAKDHGKQKQLSSSCTVIVNVEDGNNHIPMITQQTGSGRVKEGQENVLVSRLQMTDKDTKGSQAWKAKYEIQGDAKKHFRIATDQETNEGLLYVQKELDFEKTPQMNLTVCVINEVPYYTCKVDSRTTTGLWHVTTITTAMNSFALGETLGSSTYQMTVTVLDVNEPPIFDESIKQVQLFENVKAGHYLVTFTARDPDVTSANKFVYALGEDPAGWVTVDAKTGKITTSKIIDRESVYVKDNIYVVTIHAVDNGEPPMTGTATLSIHVQDENDNTPSLTATTIDICQSDRPSQANITAVDLDEKPFSGPFRFKLLGDTKDKWRVEPEQGFSVNLVKENTVYSGHYEILLEVSDLQGKTAVQNLSVTVCNCLDPASPNCLIRNAPSTSVGGGAFSIIFISMLVLAGLLLLALLVSCNIKSGIKPMPDVTADQQSLMISNIEKPGTDCKVAFDQIDSQKGGQIKTKIPLQSTIQTAEAMSTLRGTSGCGVSQIQHTWDQTAGAASALYDTSGYGMSQIQQTWQQLQLGSQTAGASSYGMAQIQQTCNQGGLSRGNSQRWGSVKTKFQTSEGNGMNSDQTEIGNHRKILYQVLDKMMYVLHAPGEELCDYTPHVYAEEGDAEHNFELDAISILDVPFDSNLDLDSRFTTLASVCMPNKSTAHSTVTTCVMGKPQTRTLIQVESHKTKIDNQAIKANYILDQVVNPTL